MDSSQELGVPSNSTAQLLDSDSDHDRYFPGSTLSCRFRTYPQAECSHKAPGLVLGSVLLVGSYDRHGRICRACPMHQPSGGRGDTTFRRSEEWSKGLVPPRNNSHHRMLARLADRLPPTDRPSDAARPAILATSPRTPRR